MDLKVGVLLAAAVLVSGCASKPAPEFPVSYYPGYANMWVLTQKCAAEGLMDPVLAAYGKKRLQQNLAGYNYDPEFLNQYIQLASSKNGPGPTKETCNPLAVEYAGARDEYDRNMRANSQGGGTAYTSCFSGALGTNCVSY